MQPVCGRFGGGEERPLGHQLRVGGGTGFRRVAHALHRVYERRRWRLELGSHCCMKCRYSRLVLPSFDRETGTIAAMNLPVLGTGRGRQRSQGTPGHRQTGRHHQTFRKQRVTHFLQHRGRTT